MQYVNYEGKKLNTRTNRRDMNRVIMPLRFKGKVVRCLESVKAVCDEVGIEDLVNYLEMARDRGDCILSQVGRKYLYVQCAAITVKVDLWEGFICAAWSGRRIAKRKKSEV